VARTVLNLIYYGLGGDVSDWSPVAQLCTRVLIQVELNGKIATLARDIAPKPGMPMDIYGGAMDAAINAPASEWSRYPYRRSESRESFSQALFRLLEIPEASNEASGNVTVHQMLRLMTNGKRHLLDWLPRFALRQLRRANAFATCSENPDILKGNSKI